MALMPISPLSAAPLLHLRLARIARTPLARLEAPFRVLPRETLYDCLPVRPITTQTNGCWRLAQHLPNKFIETLAEQWASGQLQIRRNLGQQIYLTTLLAGSQIGERLPLANRIVEDQLAVCGTGLDVWA